MDSTPHQAQRVGHGQIPALPKGVKEKAFALYKAGIPQCEIAERLQVNAHTIRAWSYRGHWATAGPLSLAQPGLSLKASTTLAKYKENEPRECPASLSERQDAYEDNLQRAAVAFSDEVGEMKSLELLQQAPKVKQLDEVARKALKIEHERPNMVINIGLLSHQPPQRHAELVEQSPALPLDA